MTTAQRIRALVKSCRDLLRKDKGLSGDIDRLPVLTWVMFLKFLDDFEQVRADEAALEGKPYKPVLQPPYRWRDWNSPNANGATNDGLHNPMTGDALIAFINQDEAIRPDGSRGPGLFAYLRSLEGSGDSWDRRDVVSSVFQGTVNRVQSGYILRDVLDKVDEIHFAASDEVHTLSAVYETMLREMRDAAGDSGEFYTPRPLVRMIVTVVAPELGETVLDPAAGTGGFLVETLEHLRPLCTTVEDVDQLQRRTLFGIEAKPLPYLLCEMNLLLHGVESPQVDPLNALRFPLTEIGDRDRVDVIMTNPPFGGEEEKGTQANFPSDRQSAETALLFLQLIMRRIRRRPEPGRAAVVVPDGTLFGDGVYARVKEELLREFRLHTIVRLPMGVFAPYADIPTNVLFFDRSGHTDDIWYYEHPLPDGYKRYTKTKPLKFEEFEPLIAWWGRRVVGSQSWKVAATEVLRYESDGTLLTCDLDIRNPAAESGIVFADPKPLLETAVADEREMLRLLERLVAELEDSL